MDTLTADERSRRMSRIRSKDTKIELVVRKLVYSMGYRYRLHVRDLPGSPDLVFRSRKKVIFVHGCFWHRHNKNCALTRWPKSKLEFWKAKLERNQERDKLCQEKLRALGFDVLVIWECQMRDAKQLQKDIRTFLEEVE